MIKISNKLSDCGSFNRYERSRLLYSLIWCWAAGHSLVCSLTNEAEKLGTGFFRQHDPKPFSFCQHQFHATDTLTRWPLNHRGRCFCLKIESYDICKASTSGISHSLDRADKQLMMRPSISHPRSLKLCANHNCTTRILQETFDRRNCEGEVQSGLVLALAFDRRSSRMS